MARVQTVNHAASLASPAVLAKRVRGDGRRCEPRPPAGHAVAHDHAVLAYHTAGRAHVELNGEWTLTPGDLLVVPAGAAHRSLGGCGGERWVLAFHVASFARRGGAVRLLEPFERVRDGGAAVVRLPSARHDYLEVLLGELAGLSAEPGGAQVEALQASLLNLILAEIRPEPAEPRGGRVVAEALRFIERNCLGRLSLQDVARAVDRSPAYVTTALTQATGQSAGRWIVSGRMAEARRLLRHSSERVEEIAARVGYADATHFIRMFRREHGDTPAAWRRRLGMA